MRIGAYDVEGHLGAGGMSQVWLARGRSGPVVLKRQLNPADDERLRDEARVGMRLRHPCVVQTLDLVEYEERPVLVLEYVAGASLVALRKKGALDPSAVCRIGGDVAEGLAALHDAVDEDGRPLRILHRDVSPSNVIVSHDGKARLIDLGIARFAGSGADRTRTGDLRGTLRYLAPELFDSAQHTPKTDLWALGVCLFEAALGRQATVGAEAAILATIIRGQLLLLKPGEQLAPPVDVVIKRLCAPEAERPATALEAVRLLRDAERKCGVHGVVEASRAVYAAAGAEPKRALGPAVDDVSELGADNPFVRFASTTYCGTNDDDLFGEGAIFEEGAIVTAATPSASFGAVPAPVTVLSEPLPSPAKSSPGSAPAASSSWAIPAPITGEHADDKPDHLVRDTAPEPVAAGPASLIDHDVAELKQSAVGSWLPVAAVAALVLAAIAAVVFVVTRPEPDPSTSSPEAAAAVTPPVATPVATPSSTAADAERLAALKAEESAVRAEQAPPSAEAVAAAHGETKLVDGAKPDGAKLVDGAKPDGAKPDGAKLVDGAKPDGAKLVDGAKPDGAKPDGATPNGARPDGARPDGAKPVAGARP